MLKQFTTDSWNKFKELITKLNEKFILKSGDTMTGNLYMKGKQPAIVFRDNDNKGIYTVYANEEHRRFYIYNADIAKNVFILNDTGEVQLEKPLPLSSGGTGRTSWGTNGVVALNSSGNFTYFVRETAGLMGWNNSGGVGTYAIPLSVNNGGTGATSAVDARTNLGIYRNLKSNPTGGSANDTADFWTNQEPGLYYINENNQLLNQPHQFGFLEHIKSGVTASLAVQRFTTSTGRIYTRYINNGQVYAWIKLIEWQDIYPVNSTFWSTENTSPASFLGGSWTSITAPTSGTYAWKRTA